MASNRKYSIHIWSPFNPRNDFRRIVFYLIISIPMAKASNRQQQHQARRRRLIISPSADRKWRGKNTSITEGGGGVYLKINKDESSAVSQSRCRFFSYLSAIISLRNLFELFCASKMHLTKTTVDLLLLLFDFAVNERNKNTIRTKCRTQEDDE